MVRRAVCVLAFVALSALALPAPLQSQNDTPLIDTRSTSTGSVIDQQVFQNIATARGSLGCPSTLPGALSGVPASVSASGDALITIDGVVIGNQGALGSPGSYVDYEHVERSQFRPAVFFAEYGNSAGGRDSGRDEERHDRAGGDGAVPRREPRARTA